MDFTAVPVGNAHLLGQGDDAIAIAVDCAKVRKQFGVTISSFQLIQHRLADIAAAMEPSRSIVYALLATLESDNKASQRALAPQAETLVSDLAVEACENTIQLHGAIGKTRARNRRA